MHLVLQVAQVLALAFAGLGLLVATGKCLESAERRGSNDLCFYGLATILFDILLAAGAALAARFMTQPVSMAVITIAFFIISLLLLTGWTLSVIGLFRGLIDRYKYFKEGTFAGAAGVLVGTAGIAGLGWLAWDSTRDGMPASMVLYHSPELQAAQPQAGPAAPAATSVTASAEELVPTPPMNKRRAEAILRQLISWSKWVPWVSEEPGFIYLREQNVRYRVPPIVAKDWVKVEPQKSHGEILVFQHRKLPIRFCVYDPASSMPQRSSDAGDARVLSERMVRFNNVTGRRRDVSYELQDKRMFESSWELVQNGEHYRMTVIGGADNHAAVLSAATDLFAGFELLDRQMAAPAPVRLSQRDFRIASFPFEVRLKGSPWVVDSTRDDLSHGISMEAVYGRNQAVLAVTPLALHDLKPQLAATTRGLLTAYPNLPAELLALEHRKPVKLGALQGFDVRASASGSLWRLRLLQGNGYAYLIFAWANQKDTSSQELLTDAIDRVKFLEVPVSSADNLTFRQQDAYSRILNEIGLYYFDAQQADSAVPYFLEALKVRPDCSVALSNALGAYSAAGRYADACKLLQSRPERLQSGKFRVRYAWLLGQLKRAHDAINAYSRAFAEGYRDDLGFADYLRMLEDDQQVPRALRESDAYLQRFDSPVIALKRVELLAKADRKDEAVALLDQRQSAMAGSAQLSYAMVEAYRKAGQPQKAMQLIESMIADGQDTAQSWYVKSTVQCALKRYEDAKVSLEKAVEKAPAEPTYKQALEQINKLLGQGENRWVREEVPAVELPAELRESSSDLLPPPAISGAGAWYRLRAKAIEFRAAKEFRETTYHYVEVVDLTGVERFSTIDVSFSPATQQVYVNRLAVYDRQGRLVAKGNVDAYYVVDETDGQIASSRKTLRIPVPGLRPGFRLEAVTTLRWLAPSEKLPLEVFPLATPLPTARSTLYLHGDVGHVVSRAPRGADVVSDIESMSWTLRQPKTVRREPLADATAADVPTVYLKDRRTNWQSEVDEYVETIHDRLKLPERTRKQALELVAGLSNDDAKVAALVRFVQLSITYKANEFGRRARVMNRSDQTLEQCCGDCKDHSLLLVHLCEAVGIRANLALVSTSQDAIPDMPSLDQFDHEIVYLPRSGSGRFVDCTDKYNDPSMPVPYSLAGKHALIVDPISARLVRVPECPQGLNRLASRRTVQCTREGELVVNERLTFHGYWAGTMRATFKGLDALERKSMLSALAPSAGVLEVLETRVENADLTDAPLILVIDYRLNQLLHADGAELSGTLPLMWEQQPLQVESMADRQTPFRLPAPVDFDVHTSLQLPQGYVLAPLDSADTAQSGQFVRWKMRVTSSPGGATIERQGGVEGGHFPAQQYSEFYREAQAARKALTPQLVIRKNGS